MNFAALKSSFTRKLRQLFVIALSAGSLIFVNVAPASATVSILDSLGAATPATQFSVFGSSGPSIDPHQFVGVKFTLTQPTTLTEIGGFVNSCGTSFDLCTTTVPIGVQIRPSTNGLPDPSTILASFVLSHDNTPFVVSFESVTVNLTLPAGTYYAVFFPLDRGGFLLGFASVPFLYFAEIVDMGFLDPTTGTAQSSKLPGAVRILGERNIFIDGCDSGVPDSTLPNDSTISDSVLACAETATTHGQFTSCVAHVTDDVKKAGVITGRQKGAIQNCVAQAAVPF